MRTTHRDWRTASRPDSLPAVEWLTYGSGWLSGMKLGDTAGGVHPRPPAPETVRSFDRCELTTTYTPAGQLQSQHLNSLLSDRDYTERQRRTHPHQQPAPDPELQLQHHGQAGLSVHTTAANLDIRIPYATDPAGNRLPGPGAAPGQHPQHVAG